MIAIEVDDEKNPRLYEAEVRKASIIAEAEEGENGGSADGDDALKFAGTHAHKFDEKYYAKLRWKIVCHLEN